MTDMSSQQAPEAAHQILQNVFGYDAFRSGQEDVVARLVAGERLLVVMPTGGGKSLCYQIPALMIEGLTIVVSPLTALMDDQVAALRASGAGAAAIHSGMPREEQVAAWRAAMAGDVKLLYMSPERLMTDRMINALQKRPPVMFVVDEVHCMSRWGVAFRPEYEMLGRLRGAFPQARLAGFTATADEATRTDINDKLLGGQGRIMVQGFDRPNLRLAVQPRTSWKQQLLAFLDDHEGESGIIYCLSRAFTEDVAAFLMGEGYNALSYHAGQDAEVRRAGQNRFMTETAVVMVATIAFGMGIDKPDIRYVVHLNLPSSMEAYYQEIGRAGRDGAPAETLMLFALEDIGKRRRFIEEEGGDDAHRRREHKRLDALLAYCEASACRRRALLAYFSEDRAPCGYCDTCEAPPKLHDGTREARMIMSAIARTGSLYGTSHILDVVRGADTAKVRDKGHDRLSCFGLGADQSKAWWQSIVRQMMAAALVTVDIAGHGALVMTAEGEALLTGKGTFSYKVPALGVRESARNARPKVAALALSEADAALLGHLKTVRLKLAEERNVPAFVVLHDATLAEMAQRRPVTPTEMLAVAGMGPKKLDAFGQAFLDAIEGFKTS